MEKCSISLVFTEIWDSTKHPSRWLCSKRLRISNPRDDVEKLKPSYTPVGNENDTVTLENRLTVS